MNENVNVNTIHGPYVPVQPWLWKCVTDPHLTVVIDKVNAMCAVFYSIFTVKHPLISIFTVPVRRVGKKQTLAIAVAIIGSNAADGGKINDRQFCSHVYAQ